MKPILLDLPMPITTPRLLIRQPQIGDGHMLNAAVIESFDTLKLYMPWANERRSLEDSEEVVRREAAHWILKPKTDPELMLLILERNSYDLIGATGYHNIDWDIPSVETGYWIRNKYAGCGLMTDIEQLTI